MSIHIHTFLSGIQLGAIAGLSEPPPQLAHRRGPLTLSVTRLSGPSCNLRPVCLPSERAILLFIDSRDRSTSILDLRTQHTFDFGHSLDLIVIHLPLDTLATDNGTIVGETPLLTSPRIDTKDDQLFSLGQCLSAVLTTNNAAAPAVLDGLFGALCTHIVQTYRAADPSSFAMGGLAPWQLKRACTLLAGNLASAPSVPVVAGYCRLSTSHFTRAFRRSMGVSPHQWLIQQRVTRAKGLLRDVEMPLASVALECGFADQSHFTRAFSSCEGVSPGRWRRDQGVGADAELLEIAA